MFRIIFVLLIGFSPQLAMSRNDETPFDRLMEFAKVKRILQVDTVAGKTNVLITSVSDNPEFLIVFAPGGEGFLNIGAKQDGLPVTKRLRNPAYVFGLFFMERQAAWAAIDTPADFGGDISRGNRTSKRHIEAIGQVAQKLRAEYPKARHILIGHSNGGITAGMQAISPKPVFDGIVLSAPVQGWLPWSWDEQVKVPIMFITHEDDACKLSASDLVIRAAGKKFPITVIKSTASGISTACRGLPAPHFFSGAEAEYVDAILKWAASLKRVE
jgi:hypothetical protein